MIFLSCCIISYKADISTFHKIIFNGASITRIEMKTVKLIQG